jgi:hypothetical protein
VSVISVSEPKKESQVTPAVSLSASLGFVTERSGE